jgi:hypothetical protein
LQQLTLDPEQAKHFTKIFQDYEGDLRALAAGQKIATSRVTSIRNFFDALAENFYRDVANSTFAPQIDSHRT